MKNNHLVSCKLALAELVNTTSSICEKYACRDAAISESVEKLRRVYEDRINDLNPRIMIYGIYNAGKSTLMNALIGENKADVNDVPTTVAVTPYQWGEYTIYDTPGINAPKKDEEVSKEHLEKSDVIIFVMDTEGAFNLGKNFRELVDIVKGKKRLLIVLNNKSNIEMDSPEGGRELEKIKGHVYRDFAECYGSMSPEELSKYFKIVVVDAKLALDARTDVTISDEDRQIMLNASNIMSLESEIITVYASASGFTVLNEISYLLSEELDAVESLLKKLNEDRVSQEGYDVIEKLERQEEGLVNKIKDRIEMLTGSLKTQIRQIISSGNDEEDAKNKISELAQEIAEEINKYLVCEVEKISQHIDDSVSGFENMVSVSLPVTDALCAQPVSADDTIAPVENKPAVSKGKGEKIVELATASKAAQPLIKKSVTAAAPLIAKIPVVGPMVLPILPYIGPILVACAALKILFGGDDRETLEKQREEILAQQAAKIAQQEEQARIKQEVAEVSESISRQIEIKLIDFFTERIGSVFAPHYGRVQDAINTQNTEAAKIAADLRNIEKSKKTLKGLISSFKVG